MRTAVERKITRAALLSNFRGRSVFLSFSICILAIALYVGFLATANWRQAVSAIHLVSGATWLAVLTLSFVNYGLRFWRWVLSVNSLTSVRIPLPDHFSCYMAGFAFTATPGKVGEVARSLFLEQRGIPRSISVSVFIFERSFDLLAIAILALFMLARFPELTFWAMAIGALFCIGFLIMQWKGNLLLQRIFFKPTLQPFKKYLIEIFSFRSSVRGLCIGLLSWTLEGVGLYCVLQVMHADVNLWLALGIYGAAVLAGALSFIPGGIGGTEAVMAGALVACGVSLPVAVAATLVCRIATLWFAVGIGFLAFLLVLARPKTKTADS